MNKNYDIKTDEQSLTVEEPVVAYGGVSVRPLHPRADIHESHAPVKRTHYRRSKRGIESLSGLTTGGPSPEQLIDEYLYEKYGI